MAKTHEKNTTKEKTQETKATKEEKAKKREASWPQKETKKTERNIQKTAEEGPTVQLSNTFSH